MPVSWETVAEVGRRRAGWDAVAAYSRPIHVTVESGDSVRPLDMAAVSSRFFSTLTLPLIAGRDFTRAEAEMPRRHMLIVSADLADLLFGSPDNAVGRDLRIAGARYTIIGVAPRGFHGLFGSQAEAWAPASMVIPLVIAAPSAAMAGPEIWKEIACFYGILASTQESSLSLAGRLAPALSGESLTGVPLQISPGITTDPVRDWKTRRWLRLGLLLSLVLTAVCVLNYALLLFARTARRLDEARVRQALGASRSRLILELSIGPAAAMALGCLGALLLWLTMMFALTRVHGAYAGLLKASFGSSTMVALVLVALAVVLTTTLAILPALRLLRESGIPDTGYATTASRGADLAIQAPVSMQIALSTAAWLVLAMVTTTLLKQLREPLGFEPSHLSVISIGPAVKGALITYTGSRPGQLSRPGCRPG